ncbi:hypothetical protein [Terrisporobacter sp.]|uniref:hypothetical protein n=1 Tax=Terrisporobacter sp. TaxID=1965305 RepID=UPI00289F5360|nr:hypothetical protein [Terrisporobacter sp.]
MKDINILNVVSNIVFSDKTKYDLQNIMGIEVGERSVLDVLMEIKDNWCNLDPIDKEAISQSIVGRYYSAKFQVIMDTKNIT